MNKQDLINIDKYLYYHQSFHDHLLFRLLLEIEVKLMDVFSLKVSDVKGKRFVELNDREFKIDTELQVDILKYCEFLNDDDFLFQDKIGRPISRTQVWRSIRRGFDALGYEEQELNFDELRGIWGGKENEK